MPFRVQPCKSFTGQRLPAGRSRAADEPDGRPSRKFYSWRCNSVLIGLTLLTLVMASAATAQTAALDRERAESHHGRSLQAEAVQLVVDSLRKRLGITAVVTVTMVEHDDRRVSVRRAPRTARRSRCLSSRGSSKGCLGNSWRPCSHTNSATCGSTRTTRTCRPNSWPTAWRCAWCRANSWWRSTGRCGARTRCTAVLETFLGVETTTAAPE